MGKSRRFLTLGLLLGLLLGLSGIAGAQKSGKPEMQPILEALGKVKLEHIKQSIPGGKEAAVKTRPGSRLDKLKVEKSYAEPKGQSIYYFNRQGILVSATTKAVNPLTKEELLREIKGLKFEKFPPDRVEAAFIRRTPSVVQGFYLSKDGKYVELSSYDYLPK